MRKLFCLIFSLLFLSQIYSQVQKVDSLKALLNEQQTDTLKIDVWYEIAKYYVYTNLDSTYKYLDQAQYESERLSYLYRNTKCKNMYGFCEQVKGQLDQALELYLEVVNISKERQYPDLLMLSSGNVGMVYDIIGEVDSAFVYITIALEKSRELKDTVRTVKFLMDMSNHYQRIGKYTEALDLLLEVTLHNEKNATDFELTYNYTSLGVIYQKIGNFDEARSYFLKAISSDKKSERVNVLDINYSNLGLSFVEKGDDYDSANFYFDKLKVILDSNYNEQIELNYLVNSGNLDFELENYESAIIKYRKAEKLSTFIMSKFTQTIVFNNIAAAYEKFNKLDSARYYLKKSLDLSKSMNSFKHITSAYSILYQIDVKEKKYESALKHHILFSNYSDSLWNKESAEKVAVLEIEYEVEKNKMKTDLFEQESEYYRELVLKQRQIGGLFLFVFVLLFILLLVVYRSRKNHKGRKLILEQQKSELELANQTKDKFFSIIAHDLRSPFSGILGLTKILETQHQDMSDEMRLDLIQKLNNASNNTFNLLTNLLNWALCQKGKIEFNPVSFNMKTKIEELKGNVTENIDKKSLNLTINVDPSLVAFTDPHLFYTVLLNLTSNAIKFTPEKGKIEILVVSMGDQIKVVVKDSGIGIPKEEIEKLLQLESDFKRLGTAQEVGTGLGLVLSSEFIKLMNGELKIESEEHKGSQFSFTFPTV